MEDEEVCSCEVPNCPCGRCHAVGWVWVSDAYPYSQYPDPPAEAVAQLPPESAAELHRQLDLSRRSAAASVYPCRACNADLFFRWRDGHLDHDHNRGACPECATSKGRRRVHA